MKSRGFRGLSKHRSIDRLLTVLVTMVASVNSSRLGKLERRLNANGRRPMLLRRPTI